jgi:hypothetical protein
MAGMGQGRSATGGPGSDRQKEFFINFEPSMVSVGAYLEPDVRWDNWAHGHSYFEKEAHYDNWERCTFKLHGEDAILRIRTNDDGEAQEAQVLIGERMIGQLSSDHPNDPPTTGDSQVKRFKYSEVPSDKQ